LVIGGRRKPLLSQCLDSVQKAGIALVGRLARRETLGEGEQLLKQKLLVLILLVSFQLVLKESIFFDLLVEH
jgi:hypothetical protein